MNGFFVVLKVVVSGLFIGVIVSIPLGPAGIESVKKTLSEGYESGMIFILGSLMADLIYMLLLYIGLASIFIYQTKRESLYYWIVSGLVLVSANYFFNKRKNNMIRRKIQKRSYGRAYLSGFVLTFLNPASITVWLTLSAISIGLWGNMKHFYYFIFLWSAWFGMVVWFFILNYLAAKGFKFLNNPREKKVKNNMITQTVSILASNSMIIIGIGFIIYGIYMYIVK